MKIHDWCCHGLSVSSVRIRRTAGDFDALVQVLDPDVVARAHSGTDLPPAVFRGVQAVAKLARAPQGVRTHPALINAMVGAVVTRNGRLFAILTFTVVNDKIVEMESFLNPSRVRRSADPPRGWIPAASGPRSDAGPGSTSQRTNPTSSSPQPSGRNRSAAPSR
ncbi:hypothetical protein ABGB18_45445 [Nonomuraea sp. B12E4]|uniref:hypothetical protein n=1 Tax=Nonomuraea sp. B12E4 TaxID=3153564 RepID=UPI00325DF37C